ncbi:MAG: TerB family tellurite resistance protein [Kiloniellales bacterium]
MSIWGKILGGAAGFAVGGPIGALLGGIAGHAVDSMRSDLKRVRGAGEQAGDDPGGFHAEMPGSESTRQVAFTVGVIVLGAKIAKVDGKVTPDEVRAFKQVFHVPPEEEKNVGRLFNLARRDARGFEPYARQLGRLFRDQPAVLERLLDALFHIARADGEVTGPELDYLEQVARLFNLDRPTWERIKAANIDEADNPYKILGVKPDASDEEIKSRHRSLVREHHPDRLIAQGMPEEMVQVANEQLARINSAYDEIRKLRGS